MVCPFNSKLVLKENISEAKLKAYHVGFEENKFRLQPLVDVLVKVIPEFAYGYSEGTDIPITKIWEKLKEAARLVYTTDKYQKRGEFGELILHLLLRDFCNTIPLISKIYFKDAINKTICGFDGVHVQIETGKKRLWLGESKIYSDGAAGILSLAKDVKDHFQHDYLRSEFNLISRKIPTNFPEREHWVNLMHEHQPLEKIFQSICVPCVCTYSSDLFQNHNKETQKYLDDFKKECSSLKEKFENANIVTDINVILMLLPIPCKDELIKNLHERLRKAQKI